MHHYPTGREKSPHGKGLGFVRNTNLSVANFRHEPLVSVSEIARCDSFLLSQRGADHPRN